ncbi:MAG: hypothetical protein LBP59_03285 [Planctomycetaceae bacterium]|nr:hypothetical protein [Planctomycetaceae bacterium]
MFCIALSGHVIDIRIVLILLVLEIQRFKSVKACRPKARQAKVNANSSTNSLKFVDVKASKPVAR